MSNFVSIDVNERAFLIDLSAITFVEYIDSKESKISVAGDSIDFVLTGELATKLYLMLQHFFKPQLLNDSVVISNEVVE